MIQANYNRTMTRLLIALVALLWPLGPATGALFGFLGGLLALGLGQWGGGLHMFGLLTNTININGRKFFGDNVH